MDEDSEATEVTVLLVKESYTYTIPSFSAITIKLKHVQIGVEEEAGLGLVQYDAFFYEGHCPNFQDRPPRQAAIKKGCLVDVSLYVSYNT